MVLVLWKGKQEDHLWLLSKSWDTWDLVSACMCRVAGPKQKEEASDPTPTPQVCRVSQPEQGSEWGHITGSGEPTITTSRSLTMEANKLGNTGRASSRFSQTETGA